MAQMILLINPIAGGGKTKNLAPRVMSNLKAQGWNVKAVAPTSEKATVDYVKGLPEGTVVVALGGDGFLARVCEGAYHSGAHVVPLPAGRGNDMCRSLGVNPNLDEAVRALPSLRRQKIDIGLANGKVFLGCVYAGFDSEASERANQFKHLTGPIVYAAAAVLKLIQIKKPYDFEIQVDGQRLYRKAWLVDVCNSGRYGGGMQVCPQSHPGDGLLEVVSVAAPSRTRFVRMIKAMFKGTLLEQNGVQWRRGQKFKVTCRQPMVAYADGDYLGDLPLEVEVKPAAVTVLIP